MSNNIAELVGTINDALELNGLITHVFNVDSIKTINGESIIGVGNIDTIERETTLPNASGIGSGDYLRTVNSNNESEKINYTLLAKAIIEQWTGSTLAGSAQSVKSAIDTLDAVMNDVPYTTNGKLKYISTIDDFNHITNEWVLTRSTTNAPVASTYFYVLTFAETRDSSGYVTTGKQIAFSYMTDSEDTYIRHGRNGTWGTWQKMLNETQIGSCFSYSGLLSSPNVSCEANSVAVMQLTVTPPSGYKFHTIDALFNSSWECPITYGWIDRATNTIGARCYNPTSSAKTVNLYAYVTYIKG